MVVPCISQALEKEERQQKEGEKLLEMDERKRSYPFSLVLAKVLMFMHNLSNIQNPHRTLSDIKYKVSCESPYCKVFKRLQK